MTHANELLWAAIIGDGWTPSYDVLARLVHRHGHLTVIVVYAHATTPSYASIAYSSDSAWKIGKIWRRSRESIKS